MPSELTTNVFLITGTDETMVQAEADALVRAAAGEDADAFSLDIVRETDGVAIPELLNQLMRSIQSPPFLGNRKTVWLQHFSAFGAEGTAKSNTAEAKALRALAEMIKAGIPDDIVLVMDGPDVDQRKALAKACDGSGSVKVFVKPDLKQRNWQQSMMDVVHSRAKAKGVSLPPDVCNHLVTVLGAETAAVDNELEKLICYCGGVGAAITLEAAEQVCSGSGEELAWALNDAVGSRDTADALRIIDVLMRKSKTPEGVARALLSQTARLFRQLIQAKLFMGTRKVSAARMYDVASGLSREEKDDLAGQGLGFIKGHPFVAKRLAEQCANYTGDELIDALRAVRDAYMRTVSTSLAPRVALEEFLIRVLQPSSRLASTRAR